MAKSIEQVKTEFQKKGISFADWAKENNFSTELVYRVLKMNRLPIRGESHKIAVKLGIKDD
ncbi:DNA-binding protein [Acinetobacter sp. B51(2017)]|uniref:DNA-binding protein n=1 Tax=Acinetobacter sp. B51(2017) TaxID=2060938 RepID=UPI000F090C5E|nr:DNA-binding protein [Acinetobacter sp. B51(2017)]